VEYTRKAYEMGLAMPWARFWIAYALAYNDRPDEAIRELREALEDGLPAPTGPMARFFLGALRGNRGEALGALDPETREYAWNDPDFPPVCAGMFALVDEKEQALEWSQHAVSRGYINYPFFATDPFLEGLRGDVRFERLVAELKPKWEAFEF
jgi:non-specific serine/threonine protein kinase